MSSSNVKKDIERLVESLDEAPFDDEVVKATVDRLGIDVKEMAAGLRARVAAADVADAAERKKRIDDARAAYAAEVTRLEERRVAGKRTREENLSLVRTLLVKAPPEAVAVHFHKYESASDEELEELVHALRHLLGEDDPE